MSDNTRNPEDIITANLRQYSDGSGAFEKLTGAYNNGLMWTFQNDAWDAQIDDSLYGTLQAIAAIEDPAIRAETARAFIAYTEAHMVDWNIVRGENRSILMQVELFGSYLEAGGDPAVLQHWTLSGTNVGDGEGISAVEAQSAALTFLLSSSLGADGKPSVEELEAHKEALMWKLGVLLQDNDGTLSAGVYESVVYAIQNGQADTLVAQLQAGTLANGDNAGRTLAELRMQYFAAAPAAMLPGNVAEIVRSDATRYNLAVPTALQSAAPNLSYQYNASAPASVVGGWGYDPNAHVDAATGVVDQSFIYYQMQQMGGDKQAQFNYVLNTFGLQAYLDVQNGLYVGQGTSVATQNIGFADLIRQDANGNDLNPNDPGAQPLVSMQALEKILADYNAEKGITPPVTLQELYQAVSQPGSDMRPELAALVVGVASNSLSPVQQQAWAEYFTVELRENPTIAQELLATVAGEVTGAQFVAGDEGAAFDQIVDRVVVGDKTYEVVLDVPAGQGSQDVNTLVATGATIYAIGEDGKREAIPLAEFQSRAEFNGSSVEGQYTAATILANLRTEGVLQQAVLSGEIRNGDVVLDNWEATRADGQQQGVQGDAVITDASVGDGWILDKDYNLSAALRQGLEGDFSTLIAFNNDLDQMTLPDSRLAVVQVMPELVMRPLQQQFVETAFEKFPQLREQYGTVVGEVNIERLYGLMTAEQRAAVAEANQGFFEQYEPVMQYVSWQLNPQGPKPELSAESLLLVVTEGFNSLTPQEAQILRDNLPQVLWLQEQVVAGTVTGMGGQQQTYGTVLTAQGELLYALLDAAANRDMAVREWRANLTDEQKTDLMSRLQVQLGRPPSADELNAYLQAYDPFEQFADEIAVYVKSGGEGLPREALRHLQESGILPYLAEGEGERVQQLIAAADSAISVFVGVEDELRAAASDPQVQRQLAEALAAEGYPEQEWDALSPDEQARYMSQAREQLNERVEFVLSQEAGVINSLLNGQSLDALSRNEQIAYAMVAAGAASGEDVAHLVGVYEAVTGQPMPENTRQALMEYADSSAAGNNAGEVLTGVQRNDDGTYSFPPGEGLAMGAREYQQFRSLDGVDSYEELSPIERQVMDAYILRTRYPSATEEQIQKVLTGDASTLASVVGELDPNGTVSVAQMREADFAAFKADEIQQRGTLLAEALRENKNLLTEQFGVTVDDPAALMAAVDKYVAANGDLETLLRAIEDPEALGTVLSDALDEYADGNSGQLEAVKELLTATGRVDEAQAVDIFQRAVDAIEDPQAKQAFIEDVKAALPVLLGQTDIGEHAQAVGNVLSGVLEVVNDADMQAIYRLSGAENGQALIAKIGGENLPAGVAPLIGDMLDHIGSLDKTRDALQEFLKKTDITNISEINAQEAIALAMTYVHDGDATYEEKARRAGLVATVAEPMVQQMLNAPLSVEIPAEGYSPENEAALLAAAKELGVNVDPALFEQPLTLTPSQQQATAARAFADYRQEWADNFKEQNGRRPKPDEYPAEDSPAVQAAIQAALDARQQQIQENPSAELENRYGQLREALLEKQQQAGNISSAIMPLFTDPNFGVFANLHEMPPEMVERFASGTLSQSEMLEMYQSYVIEPVKYIEELQAAGLNIPAEGVSLPEAGTPERAAYQQFVAGQLLDGQYGQALAGQLQGLTTEQQAELLQGMGLDATSLEDLQAKVDAGDINLPTLVAGLNQLPQVQAYSVVPAEQPVTEPEIDPATGEPIASDAEGGADSTEEGQAAQQTLPPLDANELEQAGLVDYAMPQAIRDAGIRFQYSYTDFETQLSNGTMAQTAAAQKETLTDAQKADSVLVAALTKAAGQQELSAAEQQRLYLFELEQLARAEAQGRMSLLRTQMDAIGREVGGFGYDMLRNMQSLKDSLESIPFIGGFLGQLVDMFTNMAVGIGESMGLVPEGAQEQVAAIVAMEDPNYIDQLVQTADNPYNAAVREQWEQAGGEVPPALETGVGQAGAAYSMPVVAQPRSVTFQTADGQMVTVSPSSGADEQAMKQAGYMVNMAYLSQMTQHPNYATLVSDPALYHKVHQVAELASQGPDAVARHVGMMIANGELTPEQGEQLRAMVEDTSAAVYVRSDVSEYGYAYTVPFDAATANDATALDAALEAEVTRLEALLDDRVVGASVVDGDAGDSAGGQTGAEGASDNGGEPGTNGATGGGVPDTEGEPTDAMEEVASESVLLRVLPAMAAVAMAPGELMTRAFALDWTLGELKVGGTDLSSLSGERLQSVAQALRDAPAGEEGVVLVIKVLRENGVDVSAEKAAQLQAEYERVRQQEVNVRQASVAALVPDANASLNQWAQANNVAPQALERLSSLQLDSNYAALFAGNKPVSAADMVAYQAAVYSGLGITVPPTAENTRQLVAMGLWNDNGQPNAEAFRTLGRSMYDPAPHQAVLNDAYADYVAELTTTYAVAAPEAEQGQAETNAVLQAFEAAGVSVELPPQLELLLAQQPELQAFLLQMVETQPELAQAMLELLSQLPAEQAAELAGLIAELASENPQFAQAFALELASIYQENPSLGTDLAELFAGQPEFAKAQGMELMQMAAEHPEWVKAMVNLLEQNPELAAQLAALAASNPEVADQLLEQLAELAANDPEKAALIAAELQEHPERAAEIAEALGERFGDVSVVQLLGGASVVALSVPYALPFSTADGGENSIGNAFRVSVPLPGGVDPVQQQAMAILLSQVVSRHINRHVGDENFDPQDLELEEILEEAIASGEYKGAELEQLQQMHAMLETGAFSEDVGIEANPLLDKSLLQQYANPGYHLSSAEIEGTLGAVSAQLDGAAANLVMGADYNQDGQVSVSEVARSLAENDLMPGFRQSFLSDLGDMLRRDGIEAPQHELDELYDTLVQCGRSIGQGVGFECVHVSERQLGMLSPIFTGAAQAVLMERGGGIGM